MRLFLLGSLIAVILAPCASGGSNNANRYEVNSSFFGSGSLEDGVSEVLRVVEEHSLQDITIACEGERHSDLVCHPLRVNRADTDASEQWQGEGQEEEEARGEAEEEASGAAEGEVGMMVDAFLAPPYRPIVPREMGEDAFSRLGMFFVNPPDTVDATFFPLEMIEAGEELWKWWESGAKEGRTIRDPRSEGAHNGDSSEEAHNGDTKEIRFTFSFVKGRPDIAEIISVCLVERIEYQVSFFGYCTPIGVKDTKGRRWGLADWYIAPVGGSVTEPDFVLSVQFDADRSASDFIDSIQKVLESDPWALKVKRRSGVLAGSSARRRSPINPKLREESNIMIVFDHLDISPSAGRLDLEISTLLYVNPLATTQAKDWHLPDAETLDAFNTQLSKTIKKAMEKVCEKARWADLERMVCGS